MQPFTPQWQLSQPVTAEPRGLYRHWGKRAFDLLVGATMLVALSPVMAVLWLLVVRDGGPALFGHRRVGQGGRDFTCWKFRTMVPDAEARLARLLASCPEAAREWAETHKLADDPRVTRFGRLLRRLSLDELPQLWNVLRGDMSLVGPRPVVADELERYGPDRGAYLALRPGITGLWQVSGRNAVSYAERVAMDVRYAARVGLGLDCAVLARTLGVVLRRTGL